MTSDEEAVLRERDEKRRRRVRAVRTVVLVVVLLAAAVGAMAVWNSNRRAEYAGPWCVWATPTGGTVPIWGATGGATTAPAFGDIRVTPGGAAAPGNWSSAATTVSVGKSAPWTVPLLNDEPQISIWTILVALFGGGRSIPSYSACGVQRTTADGTVWTAFMLDSLPPGAALPPAPDPACVGRWTVVTDPPPGALEPEPPQSFDLQPFGRARNAGRTGAWSVKYGVLAIQIDSELYVGVLADDLRSFDGQGSLWTHIHGTRTGD